MIKVINCKNKNYKKKLKFFLDKRRSGKITDTSTVNKIIKDIKKDGLKALIKYEKKFSKNSKIKPVFLYFECLTFLVAILDISLNIKKYYIFSYINIKI